MTILIALALLFSGGVSAAAEQALPGDALYEVKVNVNEEARSWLALSNESQANWDAQVALRRLAEAEELAARAELDADVRARLEANFEEHANRVEDRIAKFTSDDAHVAADVASNFETSLKAHDRILMSIGAAQSASVKAQVDTLLTKVRAEVEDSTSSRVQVESSVSAHAKTEAAAEGRLQATENKIASVARFIQSKEARLGASATAQAEARLAVAKNLLADGKAKLDAEAYGDAFVLFGKAHAAAQEAKLLVEAKVRFDDDGDATPTPSASVSRTPTPTATVTVTPSHIPIPTVNPSVSGNANSKTTVDDDRVESRGGINIDLGL